MKAFGVRLAFGAVTILCGAYAAALASKESVDDKSVSVSRTSPAPIAQPIAGLNQVGEMWETDAPTMAASNGPGGVAAASWIDDSPAHASLAAYDEPGRGEPDRGEPGRGHVQLVGHEQDMPAIPESAFAMPMEAGIPADANGDNQAPRFGDQESSMTAGGEPSPAAFGFDLPAMPEMEPAGAAPETSTDSAMPSIAIPPMGASAMSAEQYDADSADVSPVDAYPAAQNAFDESMPTPMPQPSMPQPSMPVLDLSTTPPVDAGSMPQSSADPYGNSLRSAATGAAATMIPAAGATPYADAPSLSGYPAPASATAASPAQNRQPAPAALPTALPAAALPAAASPATALPAAVGSSARGVTNTPPSSGLRSGAASRPLRSVAMETATMEVDPDQIFNAPGDPRLEGIQSPSIVIQKRAPAEVKVGQSAAFVVQVQNVGNVEAMDVKIHDRIPAGMRMVDATPAPMQQGDLLLWELGTMPAGDERTVTMQLIPETEGELGSVARVTFESAASVRTVATRPQLRLIQHAPPQVLIGGQVEIELEVSNPGTGIATAVTLQEDVPQNFQHPRGRQLDNLLGDIAPGEVRRQMLRMQAVEPGVVENLVRLTSQDGLVVEESVTIEVIAPKLQVDLNGPSRRFLERQATYNVDVSNLGTADATNVEIAVQLDRGFQFVRTENQGVYDASRHTVYWSLANLPSGGAGSIPLTLLPVAEGTLAMKADAKSDLETRASAEHQVSVEAFAELDFQITNPGGPVEIGGETTYEVRVTNSGSATDSDVSVQLLLPPGLELLSAEGESQTDGRGLVAFPPKTQLAPGAEVIHRIAARAVSPGSHIVKAVVVSGQQTQPVTKEESTLVYSDR